MCGIPYIFCQHINNSPVICVSIKVIVLDNDGKGGVIAFLWKYYNNIRHIFWWMLKKFACFLSNVCVTHTEIICFSVKIIMVLWLTIIQVMLLLQLKVSCQEIIVSSLIFYMNSMCIWISIYLLFNLYKYFYYELKIPFWQSFWGNTI